MLIEYDELRRLQSLSLSEKIEQTQLRIMQWYEYWDGDIYVSFSGGKDSTVLLDITQKLYPDIESVFLDTGLEFPEIRNFVKTKNSTIIRPKITFGKVISEYGYPVISKENAQKIKEIRNTKSDFLKDKRLNGDNKGNGKLSE